MHSASLEFHHPVDLTGPPSLPAADYGRIAASRSDCDWTEVSLFPSACHRLRNGCAAPFELCLTIWLAGEQTGSREDVMDVLYDSIIKEHTGG